MIDPNALRNATEADVAAGDRGFHVETDLAHVEPAALLEFWNRMLDRPIGKRDE